MPNLSWTTYSEMEPGHTYLVMASHLPLARITSTVRFFRAVAAIRKQLRSADGLVGYTLRARPPTRNYRTLSAWTDHAHGASRRRNELTQAIHGDHEVPAMGDHRDRRTTKLDRGAGPSRPQMT